MIAIDVPGLLRTFLSIVEPEYSKGKNHYKSMKNPMKIHILWKRVVHRNEIHTAMISENKTRKSRLVMTAPVCDVSPGIVPANLGDCTK